MNNKWNRAGFSSNWKYQKFLDKFRKPQCEICGFLAIKHKELYGFKITIHHRDGDNKNQNPDNLETLCSQCHANKDPNYHSKELRDLIKRRRAKKENEKIEIINR